MIPNENIDIESIKKQIDKYIQWNIDNFDDFQFRTIEEFEEFVSDKIVTSITV